MDESIIVLVEGTMVNSGAYISLCREIYIVQVLLYGVINVIIYVEGI
jgi:hypothetical protein